MFIPKNVLNYVTRKELGDRSNRPVKIIPRSHQAPIFKGNHSRYETKTGIPIDYPSAYSKKGWSSMCYKNSTRHIEVGKDWLVVKICEDYPQWISVMIEEL